MKLLSWNVAGIRACIKKDALNFLLDDEWDIVCFQETKAEAHQVTIPEALSDLYPYRFWQSSQGIKQRKGLSGTAIWCRTKPVREIDPPDFDVEGRVTALEFDTFNIVTVYTPNSQKLNSERNIYRIDEWDIKFRDYVSNLQKEKNTIICGDLNVARSDIEVYNPKGFKNKQAGYFDCERVSFDKLLERGWTDSFRHVYPEQNDAYTYWNQRIPSHRLDNKGWRIDYFLVPDKMKKNIHDACIYPQYIGSDHCPIGLTISEKKKYKLVIKK